MSAKKTFRELAHDALVTKPREALTPFLAIDTGITEMRQLGNSRRCPSVRNFRPSETSGAGLVIRQIQSAVLRNRIPVELPKLTAKN
jgi:hypothetical protein